PSKTLRETALYLSGHQSRALYGVAVELDPTAELVHLMARKNAIAESESRRIRQNLARHQVTYARGVGKIVDPHTVTVDGGVGVRSVTVDFILVATGSRPFRPKDIDFADDRIHDSDELLGIGRLPERMIILGAGVIGCEYACMFAALGTKVMLVDTRD